MLIYAHKSREPSMMNKVRHFGFHEDFPDIRGGVPVNHSGSQYNSTRGPLRRAYLKNYAFEHFYFWPFIEKDTYIFFETRSQRFFSNRSHFYVPHIKIFIDNGKSIIVYLYFFSVYFYIRNMKKKKKKKWSRNNITHSFICT